MKKEVENKKIFIRVQSFSESSGDESEKAKPKIEKGVKKISSKQ